MAVYDCNVVVRCPLTANLHPGDIPTTKRQRAQLSGGCTVGARAAQRPRHRRRARSAHADQAAAGARAHSAHAIGAERVARGADRAAARARARSDHAIGAERVARGSDGSQRLLRPAHRRAAPSAPSAEAPSAEREAAIRLAAGARARSARAIGAPGDNRLHIAITRVSLEQHITVKLEQYKLGGYCLLAPT